MNQIRVRPERRPPNLYTLVSNNIIIVTLFE